MEFQWSEDKIDRLIDLYESRPFLYDKTHQLYCNRDARLAAESEIGAELSTNGRPI